VREQFFMLLIDEKAALAAIPSLLPGDTAIRREGLDAIRQVMEACGSISAEDEKRLSEIGRLFGIEDGGGAIPFPQNRRAALAKPSREGTLS
jgi:hypothetical protein